MDKEKNICQCRCKEVDVEKEDVDDNDIKKIWRDFLLGTSFHGCKNIGEKRRGVVYRIIWTVAVLGMLGCLIKVLSESTMRFYEFRINTKNSIEVHREMIFPAVTVCPAAMFNTYRKNISETIKNYFASGTVFGGLIPTVNLTHPDLEHTTIKYAGEELTISDVKGFILHDRWHGSGNVSFKPISTNVGKCFVANNDIAHQAKATVEGRAGGLEMILDIEEHGIIMQNDMTYGARIFLHDPRDYPRTEQSGVMVAPGNSVYIGVKPTKYKFLPAPYKSYGDSYCMETDDSYSYEACLSDWLTTHTATYCNCSGGTEPSDILERYPSCSLKRFYLCYLLTYGRFEKQTLMENFTQCPKPCSFTRYETSVSSSKFPSAAAGEVVLEIIRNLGHPEADLDFIRRSLIQVTIYFDRFFLENAVYEPQVTWDSILSSVGGQMGLFLGASFLTVAELGEVILWTFWALGKKLRNVGNDKKNISSQKS